MDSVTAHTGRLKKIKGIIKARGLDGILIADRSNLFYVSGFTGDKSCLLISPRHRYIVTDGRFAQEAEALRGYKIEFREGPMEAALARLLKRLGIRRLGFSQKAVSLERFEKMRAALRNKAKLVGVGDPIGEMRKVKDGYEVSIIKKAAGITMRAFKYISRYMRPGLSEEEAALKLLNNILSNGALDKAFDIIVASGNNSSRPHAIVTKRVIKKGDSVIVDMGAKYKGYNSDLTRTFRLGRINSKLKDIYSAVAEAQRRAIKAIRPGVRTQDVDGIARTFLTGLGYGEFFSHGLGHSIGIDIHEPPYLSQYDKEFIRAGMIFTVEPAVYIKGVGGVRIEDMVLVNRGGCEVL